MIHHPEFATVRFIALQPGNCVRLRGMVTKLPAAPIGVAFVTCVLRKLSKFSSKIRVSRKTLIST